jgi:hypothetical protein
MLKRKQINYMESGWPNNFKKHDPEEVVKKHCVMVKIKAYIHEDNPFDIIFQRDASSQRNNRVWHAMKLEDLIHENLSHRGCCKQVLKSTEMIILGKEINNHHDE